MEHVSKEERTPKEGYLTKETAREPALTMQYKYGESFAVYKCQQCGFYHIGRNGGIMMENDNQNKLEIETQPPHPTRHPCPDLTRDEWETIGESNGWLQE